MPLRCAECAIGRRRRLVRIDKVAVVPDIRAAVQVQRRLPCPPHDSGPRSQVRARVHKRSRVNGSYRAVILHAHLHRRLRRVALPARDKLFLSRRLDLHRLPRPARKFRRDNGQTRLVLAAKPRAKSRANHPYVIAVNSERRGKTQPVRMHSARSLPHRQLPVLPHRNGSPWLKWRRRVCRSAERHAENAVRLFEALIDIPPRKRKGLATHQIALGMYRRTPRLQCLSRRCHERQLLIAHFEQARGVLRKVLVIRRHGRDLVAHITHFLVENRQVGREPAARHIERRQNGMHPIQILCRRGVNAGYPGMRMRTTDNLAMQHSRQLNVARILRLTRKFLRQVMPRDRCPYYRIHHQCSTAARFTDSIMRPYALHLHRLPDNACRISSSVGSGVSSKSALALSKKPGVQ